jgi:hypothetical protein
MFLLETQLILGDFLALVLMEAEPLQLEMLTLLNVEDVKELTLLLPLPTSPVLAVTLLIQPLKTQLQLSTTPVPLQIDSTAHV